MLTRKYEITGPLSLASSHTGYILFVADVFTFDCQRNDKGVPDIIRFFFQSRFSIRVPSDAHIWKRKGKEKKIRDRNEIFGLALRFHWLIHFEVTKMKNKIKTNYNNNKNIWSSLNPQNIIQFSPEIHRIGIRWLSVFDM